MSPGADVMLALQRQFDAVFLFEELHEAVDTAEAGAAARRSRLTDVFAATEQDAAEDERADLHERNAVELEIRGSLFSQLVLRGLFITAYAGLEQLLSGICSDLKEDLGLLLSERDISDRGIKRSVAYIRKAAGISFNPNDWKWDEVLRYQELRNHVTHVGDTILDSQGTERNRVGFSAIPGLTVEPAGEIRVNAEFVRTSISTFQHFTHGVFAALTRFNSARND